MKRTGMKRALDPLGRIALPKEMRDTMDILISDPLEFFIEGKELTLRKYKSTLCVFCGVLDTDMYFKEQFICRVCASELKHPENLTQRIVPQSEKPTVADDFNSNSEETLRFESHEKSKDESSHITRKTSNKLTQLKNLSNSSQGYHNKNLQRN